MHLLQGNYTIPWHNNIHLCSELSCLAFHFGKGGEVCNFLQFSVFNGVNNPVVLLSPMKQDGHTRFGFLCADV